MATTKSVNSINTIQQFAQVSPIYDSLFLLLNHSPIDSPRNLDLLTNNYSPSLSDTASDDFLQFQRMPDLHSMMSQLNMDGDLAKTHANSPTSTPASPTSSAASRELILLNANIGYPQLLQLLQMCGEVKQLSQAADMQQAWYVVYYDVRSAQTALSTYQGRSIDGVQDPLEIHSKPSWTDKEGLGDDCVVVSNVDPTSSVSDINALFNRFGDIADVITLPLNRRAIRFFDTRSADAAYSQLVSSGVVTKPMQATVVNSAPMGMTPSDSASSFGGMGVNGFGGLPIFGGQPTVSTPQLDANLLMGQLPSTQALSQLGMLHNMNMMPTNPIPKADSVQNLASLAFGSPVLSNPQLMALQQQNGQIEQMAQMMAAIQAQTLISAAQGILKSASLNNLDLSKLAQQQVEIARKAEMARKYTLNPEKVKSGEDTRTTLMIKNIPNKYSPQMLLDTINEAGLAAHYDFLYLPIDFRNRCNVGYAFINMRNTDSVLMLFNEFNGRTWERFNSEKMAQVAYGRIQGREQLIVHFQNSSLMLEDESCRPMLFNEQGEQEEFAVGPDAKPRLVTDHQASEQNSTKASSTKSD